MGMDSSPVREDTPLVAGTNDSSIADFLGLRWMKWFGCCRCLGYYRLCAEMSPTFKHGHCLSVLKCPGVVHE
jgi:hypothetical protein